MTSREFCYWLQGFFEIEGKARSVNSALEDSLNAAQVDAIRAHLNLVFVHEIDPSAGDAIEQAKLNAVHQGVSKEEVQQAIKEAIDKLPRPTIGGHGPGGTLLRC